MKVRYRSNQDDLKLYLSRFPTTLPCPPMIGDQVYSNEGLAATIKMRGFVGSSQYPESEPAILELYIEKGFGAK
jgi:hypothetical protein